MCNCIEDTEKRYKKHLKEKDPFFKDIDFEVEFENKAYMFDSGKTELTVPMGISWRHTAKSGRTSTKNKISNFTISYCPFCGEKTKGKGVENED